MAWQKSLYRSPPTLKYSKNLALLNNQAYQLKQGKFTA
ncbi:hypothetical protein HBZC1_17320 [Helicobacter bizzozeronii CIII-1]|uniref:Uncharacterized protein n=1 Tax=Helicobacter bizzozeronii (strain CIII-1) TaxID=1002804 RepID=F8KPJ4_HELBC|nr:hypothetical protein HBZC1_17320 [Helicobacter bizzozeronii CIII-1]